MKKAICMCQGTAEWRKRSQPKIMNSLEVMVRPNNNTRMANSRRSCAKYLTGEMIIS